MCMYDAQSCSVPDPGVFLIQDRINSLPLSGPHRLSSNDLLCSILWHVSCLVRDRTNSSGTFYLPFDLRQMHVPDAYFGNAHSMLSVRGKFTGFPALGDSEMTLVLEKSSFPTANPMQRKMEHITRSLYCHSDWSCLSSQLTLHCSIKLSRLLFVL